MMVPSTSVPQGTQTAGEQRQRKRRRRAAQKMTAMEVWGQSSQSARCMGEGTRTLGGQGQHWQWGTRKWCGETGDCAYAYTRMRIHFLN